MVHTHQEMEVWYIIPSIRRELARVMVIEQKLTQKHTANLLGVTEAAISNYISSKRGKEIDFSEHIANEIRKSAQRIINDKKYLVCELRRICNLPDVRMILCKLHKNINKNISEYCRCG